MYKILVLILLILLICVVITIIIYYVRLDRCENELRQPTGIEWLRSENEDLKKTVDYLHKVKSADENIFSFLRCQNIPLKPVCKHVDEKGNSVCRARFVDCNKFKLVLMDDPIAIDRIRLATDVLTDHRYGRSETQYPVRDWVYGVLST